MKITYKIILGFVLLILLVAAANIYTTSHVLENLQEERLRTSEVIFAKGLADHLYRAVIEEKIKKITEVLLDEKSLREDKIEYITVVDRKGHLLAHTYLNDIPKILVKRKAPSFNGKEYILQTISEHGLSVYDIAVPVREGTLQIGTIHVGIRSDYLHNIITPIRTASGSVLIITFFVTLVAIVIAVLLSRSITNPLLKLKKLAVMVSSGNMETRIDIKSKDEIGDLARSFNQMADDLKRKTVSKDYVDNIINSMIDTLIVTSPEGVILRTNAAANRLLGYADEELAGLPVTTVIDEKYPGDGQFSDDEFITGFIGNRETIYAAKDGSKVPVMLSASIMREASGNIQGIVCVAQNITSLRYAEGELIARANQQEVIVKLGRCALMNDNLDELMDVAVSLVAGTLGVKFCKVLEFQAEEGSFLLRAGTGWKKGLVGNARIQAGKDSQAGYTLLSTEPVIVHNAATETRFGLASILTDHNLVSGMSVAIGDHESPYGVLSAHTEVKRTFTGNDIKFLQAVSNILAEAIERKKAEDVILQTKQDWEDTFNTITDMVTVHDKDYNIIRANKAAEKILGLPFLAKSTAKCFQYYHGADAPPEGCPSCNCLKTKEPCTFNVFEPHLNRFIEISSIPRIDGNKQLVGLIHIVRDITERKKDEERLMESEEKFRNLLETASDLIQSVDMNGRFLYVNRKWLDVLGYTMNEVDKMTFMDVISDDYKPHCAELFKKLCAGESVGQVETVFLTKCGMPVHVEGNINVQYKDGRFVATQGIFRDITERKQTETELAERMHHAALLADVGAALTQSDDLQTVLQSCTDSIVINLHAAFARIWTLNENGNVLELQASSGIHTHLDESHRRIPVGKSKIGLIALERVPHLTNNVFEDPEIGEPEWARQHGLTAFAGHPLVVADKLVGVIALFHYDPLKEITLNALSSVADEIAIGIERNNSKERLKEYSQKLKKSNEELEQFAYVASHDLQEPLRKVTTFGDRLKTKYSESLGDNGRDYLERMQGAAMRMQTLINDLLTFSRVMTKAQPFAPVDLAEVTRDVVSDLEVRIEQAGAHIEVDKLEMIDADPLQMRQLLQNLIGNSLKFIKKDVPPVIKVSGTFVNGNGNNRGSHSSVRDLYEITVEDNGIGFDEKYTDRIFGVFQRLHGRSEYEGTGIGLSICKKIVVRHNGSITAQSAPGRGARFIVVLPVKQIEGMTNQKAAAEIL